MLRVCLIGFLIWFLLRINCVQYWHVFLPCLRFKHMESMTYKLSIHRTDHKLFLIILDHWCIYRKFGLTEMNRFFLLHEILLKSLGLLDFFELEVVKIWNSLIHALNWRVALLKLSLHNLDLWGLFQFFRAYFLWLSTSWSLSRYCRPSWLSFHSWRLHHCRKNAILELFIGFLGWHFLLTIFYNSKTQNLF